MKTFRDLFTEWIGHSNVSNMYCISGVMGLMCTYMGVTNETWPLERLQIPHTFVHGLVFRVLFGLTLANFFLLVRLGYNLGLPGAVLVFSL